MNDQEALNLLARRWAAWPNRVPVNIPQRVLRRLERLNLIQFGVAGYPSGFAVPTHQGLRILVQDLPQGPLSPAQILQLLVAAGVCSRDRV